MLQTRRHAFASLAFASALLGVILPVACGGGDETNSIKVSTSSADTTTTGSPQASGSGGSTLQFMDGPMTGSGGEMTTAMSSSGTGEGPIGKVTYAFDYTFGGNGQNDAANAYDVAIDKLGNIVVAGNFKGTIDFDGMGPTSPVASKGGFDVFVAKYDSKGALKWLKIAGDGSDQVATSVAVDKDGRVGFCGSFRGGMNFGGNTIMVLDQQYTDAYAVVLDGDGNHVASQRFGDGFGNSDSCSGVAFDPTGNLVMAGQYQNKVTFVTVTLNAPGAGDFPIYLAKLTANPVGKNFTAVFAKSFGTTAFISQGLSVAVAADGDIALGGTTEGPISFGGATLTPKNFPLAQAVVARFDAMGTAKYNQILESTGESQVSAVAFHSNGDLVIGGHFKKTIDLGAGPVAGVGANNDVFVARLDKNNKLLFAETFGDGKSDELYDLAIDPAGFPVFVGTFQGDVTINSMTTFQGKGIRDGMVVKVAADDGHGYWGHAFGDPEFQEARGVAIDGSGNVIYVGSFKGTVDLGGGIRVAPNGSQSFAIGSLLP